ncbi:hypothetical protein BDR07DRAFT_1419103 [Suillus spraguei]|nr:hypothetical protein BDR07DRAFT_1419103 [Suillus spraguei]
MCRKKHVLQRANCLRFASCRRAATVIFPHILSITLLTHIAFMIVGLIEHSITGARSDVGCAFSDLIVQTLQGIN